MLSFSNWTGGIGKSRFDQNALDNLTNCDVHSELGVLKCQLALTSESATPNQSCIAAEVSNGDVFFFSTTSGKIWKRTAAGVYSLVHTNTISANLGARCFNGNLYYASATKLGKIAEANASSEATWSTQNDSFGTFTNGSSYKPMAELNLSLFIGDGKFVASVDSAGTFSANVLDIPANHSATALTGVGTDLLIGTIIGTNVNKCKVFLWDTYSPSWTTEDEVNEIGVNCFILGDNITFAQCGTAGQLYYWTGARMEKFKKIRSVTTAVNSYASTMLAGKAMFGVATKIFSIHRADNDMPYVIVQEYTATTGTIKSIIGLGTQLLVSNGSNINKIGTSYATATIDTPEADGKFQNIQVAYDSIGSGGTVGIASNIDNAGSYTAQTAITDSINKKVFFNGGLGTVNSLQGRVTLTPSGANNISIKSINLL